MTDVRNDCGHQCFIIGGPFISEDPSCPEHGSARRVTLHNEQIDQAFREELAQIRVELNETQREIERLRSIVNDTPSGHVARAYKAEAEVERLRKALEDTSISRAHAITLAERDIALAEAVALRAERDSLEKDLHERVERAKKGEALRFREALKDIPERLRAALATAQPERTLPTWGGLDARGFIGYARNFPQEITKEEAEAMAARWRQAWPEARSLFVTTEPSTWTGWRLALQTLVDFYTAYHAAEARGAPDELLAATKLLADNQ